MTYHKQLYYLCLCLFLLAACRSNKNGETDIYKNPAAEYQDYISAFSSGIISSAAPIKIRFANDMVDHTQLGRALDPIIEFSPTIKGKTSWESTNTLSFVPETWLPNGQKFSASINLKPYFPSIPDQLAHFKWAFQVIEQQIEIETFSIKEENLSELNKLLLSGAIYTADAAKPEEVQSMLKAIQQGNDKLEISWQHQNELKKHLFEVRNISRAKGAKDGELSLNWDGTKLGIKKTGVEKVVVPNSDFKVMKVAMRQQEGEDPYISILFSKPVDPQLLLNSGMIQLLEKSQHSNTSYDNYDYGDANLARSGPALLSNGSEVKCFIKENRSGPHLITISNKLKSIEGDSLLGKKTHEFTIQAFSPAVKIVGNGVIIPQTKGLYFPFEAINLKAVDVEIFKIYENNVLDFLQYADLDGNNNMRFVGRIVMQKRIMLQDINPQANLSHWARYALNLDELVKKEPGAIYQVRISFRRAYANYSCIDASELNMQSANSSYQPDEESGEYHSIYYGRYPDYYDYAERKDPCAEAYYNSTRFVQRNVLASNLGIIAKRAKNKEMMVVVTDLLTTKPLPGATIEVYDFSKQSLATVATAEMVRSNLIVADSLIWLLPNMATKRATCG